MNFQRKQFKRKKVVFALYFASKSLIPSGIKSLEKYVLKKRKLNITVDLARIQFDILLV